MIDQVARSERALERKKDRAGDCAFAQRAEVKGGHDIRSLGFVAILRGR